MKLRELLRTDLEDLEDYVPVKPLDVLAAEIGLPVERLVKLDANENLYGPHPEVLEAIRSAPFHIYPDPGQQALREAIARFLDVEAENIVAGTGADDLLDILIRLVMPKAIAIPTPTFGMYRFLAKISRAKPIEVPRRPNFDLDVVALKHAVQAGAGIVFLTSPNNPTGNPVNRAELEAICALDTLVVVDEAYIEFLDSPPDLLSLIRNGAQPNLLLMRTFSKIFGLAGLRLGYGIGHPELVAALERVRQPFNINSIAQAGALGALDDTEHVRRTRENNSRGLQFFAQEFRRSGLEFIPAAANFILVRVGDGQQVFEAMQRQGVIVRPMGGYQLGEWIRITVGKPEENGRCLDSLKRALGKS